MSKIGVWHQDELFRHASIPISVDQIDVCIDLLSRKLCPIHLSALVLYRQIWAGDDYTRKRYGCMYCGCTADFVGDELKSDSVGRTLDFINLMVKDLSEVEAANTYPTSEDGIKV